MKDPKLPKNACQLWCLLIQSLFISAQNNFRNLNSNQDQIVFLVQIKISKFTGISNQKKVSVFLRIKSYSKILLETF